MKRVLICYFSCTGNTETACEYIKHNLTGAVVDLVDIRNPGRPEFDQYDLIGFAAYTDWCDTPLLMQTYLKCLPVLQDIPVFIFNTCAGLSGKTLKTMNRLVHAKGYRVVAGFTLYAPESCPLLRVMGKTKEELPAAGNLAEFKKFIQRLNDILTTGSSSKFRLKLGWKDALTPGFPRKAPKLAMGRRYLDRDLCNRCGLCEKVCPYQAIIMEDFPASVSGRCAGCWACFNNCPQNAIYTKRIRGKGHYKGPVEAYKHKLRVSP